MDRVEPQDMERDQGREVVQAFYDLHPYPPPVADLDGYRRRWQDERRRRADFYLCWPHKVYQEELAVLVAGCGTAQAAKHALRQPASHIVGVDISEASVHHTLALKDKYNLTNLEVHHLPIERVGELERRFDKVVCTGVLHHLPDPEAGLRALREVLAPDGAMHLMVYAAYGRAGVYMLQEYCRRLGIGHTEQEIKDLAATLTALPRAHPLVRLLAESPDFQRSDGLADALLNPLDRAYTVPQVFDLMDACGLAFGRWVRQAPYLAQCGALARTPHAARLARLPSREQTAAVELLRGTLLRHSLIVHRDDWPHEPPRFDVDGWPSFRPIRMPEAITVQERLPPGAAAVLINREHTDSDLFLPVDRAELRLVEAIDGRRSLGEIVRLADTDTAQAAERLNRQARSLFERLWLWDQVVLDTSTRRADGNGKAP